MCLLIFLVETFNNCLKIKNCVFLIQIYSWILFLVFAICLYFWSSFLERQWCKIYFITTLSKSYQWFYSYKANTPLWLFKGTNTIPSTLTLHVHKTFILQRVSYSICIMPAVVNLVDFSFRISMHFSQPKFPFSGYQKLCWMPSEAVQMLKRKKMKLCSVWLHKNYKVV